MDHRLLNPSSDYVGKAKTLKDPAVGGGKLQTVSNQISNKFVILPLTCGPNKKTTG